MLTKSGTVLTPLQQRFVLSGLEGFSDEEVLELVVSLFLPRRKVKPRVKELIQHFGSLKGLITASPEQLERAHVSPIGRLMLRLLKELPAEFLKQRVINRPIYDCSKELFDYLRYSMRDLKEEVFKVIHLNGRGEIVDTIDLFEGTWDSIPIHPREIVESAIEHKCANLVFVHNHPSGDPSPSRSDKQLTRDMVFAGNIIQIKVLDHIIIGGDTYFSFADDGLIQKYEDDFLNLKIKAMRGRDGALFEKLMIPYPNPLNSRPTPARFQDEEGTASSPARRYSRRAYHRLPGPGDRGQ